MKIMIAVTMLVPLMMFCGCGAYRPSEQQGKQVVTQTISESGNNCLRLVSFHKTNGKTWSDSGIPMYTLEYEVEIETTKDCYWANGIKAFNLSDVPQEQKQAMAQFFVKKAVRRKMSGEISFEKTENGWKDRGARFNLGIGGAVFSWNNNSFNKARFPGNRLQGICCLQPNNSWELTGRSAHPVAPLWR